jgi:hypothetical protein
MELAYGDRERINSGLLCSIAVTVDDETLPGWEIQIDAAVHLWIAMRDFDVYASGDRAFASTRIGIATLA